MDSSSGPCALSDSEIPIFGTRPARMKSDAIRHELIEWISKLEDQGLMGSLLGIKKATQQNDRADGLSVEERRSIERGLADLKNGRSVTSADFWTRHGR